MKRLFIGIGLFTAIVLLGRETLLLPNGKLQVHFLAVGQGDATLITTPTGKQVLIDGGPNLDVLEHLGRHLSFFDRSIDLVILSHPDADHLTALPEVLRRYQVGAVALWLGESKSGLYADLLSELEQQSIPVISAFAGKQIDLGDGVNFNILWPHESTDPSKYSGNNLSVVTRLAFGKHSILFTGDVEELVEAKILATGVALESNVLKVPHHGSRTSSSTGFLLAVDPRLAIISAGEGNRFGHPHLEVTNRYRALNIPVRTTLSEGSIVIEFNDSSENPSPNYDLSLNIPS